MRQVHNNSPKLSSAKELGSGMPGGGGASPAGRSIANTTALSASEKPASSVMCSEFVPGDRNDVMSNISTSVRLPLLTPAPGAFADDPWKIPPVAS